MTNQTFQSSSAGPGVRDEFYGTASAQPEVSQDAPPDQPEESQSVLPAQPEASQRAASARSEASQSTASAQPEGSQTAAPIRLEEASGTLPIPMSNDYLFRALMQRNRKVLKALICSLLHLEPAAVTNVTILNPIELGEDIDDKTYILDIKVEINWYLLLNLELQVINERNWPERSLCYLSRTFDSLDHGQDYGEVRPAIQIGLLNFTLFEGSPEFYANYYIMNAKNHRIYSDKFRLSVVDLTQIKLATEEDRAYQIDQWAALFTAATWEELEMLAKANPNIQEAVFTVAKLTQDEKIRQQCEAREDYYHRVVARERLLENTKRQLDRAVAQLDQTTAERDKLLKFIQEHGLSIPEGEN